MDGKELLEYFQNIHRESNRQRFLDSKGYVDPNDDAFGINLWTRLLSARSSPGKKEELDNPAQQPDHLVSFLFIPSDWEDDLLDTNSQTLRDWLSEYIWTSVPSLRPPFIQEKFRPCSEGLLLPSWLQGSNEEKLEKFMLLRRDGVIEFGIGREAYSNYEKYTVFQLILIVGRLWQFLTFVNDLNYEFFSESPNENLCFVNIRGTENALMGNLAKGWKPPIPPNSYNSYSPNCLEKHIRIQRRLSLIDANFETIIHWFASRIENCWGQDEPRCYVHPNYDESQSFAQVNH